MKPVFKEERLFLKKHGIDIPEYCWRKGSKIYLNSADDIPIVVLDVDGINEKISIKKSLLKKVNGYNVDIEGVYRGKKVRRTIVNKTFKEEALEHIPQLEKLVQNTIDQTVNCINSHPNHEIRISISGGKDSSVMNHIFKKYIVNKIGDRYYKYDAFNTTNEVADTYRQMYREGVRKKDINNPVIKGKSMGWYQWIEQEKNYWIPNKLKRSCCSTFKEGQAKNIMDKDKEYIIMLGVRKYESVKREFYEFDINKAYEAHTGKKVNVPKGWKRVAPICYWNDIDIWLYIILENITVNPLYTYGFNRCGCLICPYNSDYSNMLVKEHYPKMWDRWVNILLKNYSIKRIGKRLKWSEKEWCGGKWKVGFSKDNELIQLKKTKARVEELASIKNISTELAEKYWENKCSLCGKKINPHEVAMNLKCYGRNMNTKKFQCKICFCKCNNINTKKYAELVTNFINNDCNLF